MRVCDTQNPRVEKVGLSATSGCEQSQQNRSTHGRNLWSGPTEPVVPPGGSIGGHRFLRSPGTAYPFVPASCRCQCLGRQNILEQMPKQPFYQSYFRIGASLEADERDGCGLVLRARDQAAFIDLGDARLVAGFECQEVRARSISSSFVINARVGKGAAQKYLFWA
jgi:hypothetical protein